MDGMPEIPITIVQNQGHQLALQLHHSQQNESPKDETSSNQQEDEKKSSSPQEPAKRRAGKSDTSNFTDYQRVWILICLDRARTVLGMDSQSKITSKLHRYTCELLQVEKERSLIYRKPTIKSLKTIWEVFIEHKQISRSRRGGPKPKKCREEVENLLKQNLSFRQIVKKLKPEISVSTTTVGRIAEDMKKESRRKKAMSREKKLAQTMVTSGDQEITYPDN